MVRFEGVLGKFSQHDFGQVDARYTTGGIERIHFFVSRLKGSRVGDVALVPDEREETLIRALLRAFFRPLSDCAVLTRSAVRRRASQLRRAPSLDLGPRIRRRGLTDSWPRREQARATNGRPCRAGKALVVSLGESVLRVC